MNDTSKTDSAEFLVDINHIPNTGVVFAEFARDLEIELNKYKDALAKIEKFGHGKGHGCGYSCANIAEEALK